MTTLLPRFPASLLPSGAVTLDRSVGGTVTFGLDYRPVAEVPLPDPNLHMILLQNESTGAFVRTSLLDATSGGFGVPYLKQRDGVGSAPVNIQNILDVWNNAGLVFRGIDFNITNGAAVAPNDPAALAQSSAFRISTGGNPRFEIRPDGTLGQVIMYNSTGSNLGGLALTSGGTMALTHLIDGGTGKPAEVCRYYWETTPAAGVAVLRGMGSNRFSIESGAAIVHIAGNGRYEWEGLGAQRLSWNSYQAGSSIHRPIDINLSGTVEDSPALNLPILSLSTVAGRTNDLLALGLFDGASTWTTYARFDSTGKLFAPAVEAPGDVKGNLRTNGNAVAGAVVPTHTIVIKDGTGTSYRVPCLI